MTAVCITTYNHAPYIAQCIESVLSQQCDEPVRIYIGDDASTDNTEEVCRWYAGKDARIRYIRRQENVGLTRNTLMLYREIIADGAAYIAMLDGDDYWTATDKLQRQTKYLEAHPQIGFVHTGGGTVSGGKKWVFGQRKGMYGIDSPGFANCTVMFRTSLLSEELIQDIEAQDFRWLDYPLYGVFYQTTRWAYLPEPTAMWRDHVSVSQPTDAEAVMRLREERVRMWRWLDERFPGEVGYTAEAAREYLLKERLNIIYAFDERKMATEELLSSYKPASWKLRVKLFGLKSHYFYTILQKCTKKFANTKKKL